MTHTRAFCFFPTIPLLPIPHPSTIPFHPPFLHLTHTPPPHLSTTHLILPSVPPPGGFPYPSVQNEDLLSFLKSGYRMEKPDNCSPEVYVAPQETYKQVHMSM